MAIRIANVTIVEIHLRVHVSIGWIMEKALDKVKDTVVISVVSMGEFNARHLHLVLGRKHQGQGFKKLGTQ